jgi:hypothetical protein
LMVADGRWRSSLLALTMFAQLKPVNCSMLDAPHRWHNLVNRPAALKVCWT